MSVKHKADRVRLEVNVLSSTVTDKFTGAAPSIWRGADGQIEFGLVSGTDMVDVSDYAFVRVDIKPVSQLASNPLMTVTADSSALTPNAGITKTQWDAGTAQHAIAAYSHTDSALPFLGNTSQFMLIVWAQTTVGLGSKIIPLATNFINVDNSGFGGSVPSSVTSPTFMTLADASAIFQPISDLSAINTHLTTLDGQITSLQAADTAFTATGLTYTLKDGSRAFTGQVLLANSTPSTALAAASKGYVDTQDALKAALAGATFTGDVFLANSTAGTSLKAASQGYVDTKIAALVASSPSALDTLNELASALGNDANFSNTVNTALGARLKIDGTNAMTGLLSLVSTNPSSGVHATHKGYVDGRDALLLPLAGGTASGEILFSGVNNPGLRLATVNAVDILTPHNGNLIYDSGFIKGYFSTLSSWLKLLTESYTGAVSITGVLSLISGNLTIDSQQVVGPRGSAVANITYDSAPTISNNIPAATNLDSLGGTGGTPSTSLHGMPTINDGSNAGSADKADVDTAMGYINDNFASLSAELDIQRALNTLLLNAVTSLADKLNTTLSRLRAASGHGLIS